MDFRCDKEAVEKEIRARANMRNIIFVFLFFITAIIAVLACGYIMGLTTVWNNPPNLTVICENDRCLQIGNMTCYPVSSSMVDFARCQSLNGTGKAEGHLCCVEGIAN